MKYEKIDPAAGHRGAGLEAGQHSETDHTQLRDPAQHALAALRMGLRYKTDPSAVAPVARLLLTDTDVLWIAAVAHHALPPELADEFHRVCLHEMWARTDWRGRPGL